jgi:ATP-binding cassette, subfamily B, bacterial MsbA
VRPGERKSNPHGSTGSKTGVKALRPYLSLLRGQEIDLIMAIVLMFFATGVSLAIPVFAGRFIDTMADSSLSGIGTTPLTILGILLVAQLIGSFFFTLISSRLGLHTMTCLRGKLFTHLMDLPALYFSNQKAGDLSSRLTSDVGSIQYLLTSGTISLARALFTLLGAIVLMFSLNLRLTVVVLLLIPSTILLVRMFGTRLRSLSRTMYDELGRISSHVQETVGGIRTIKVYNNQDHENERFTSMLGKYQTAGMKRAWISAALESGIQMSLWVCLIAVVIYGFRLTAQGLTTSGDLVTFLLLAFRVAMPLASLTSLYSSAQGAVAAANRLDEIFSMQPERDPGIPSPPPIHKAAAITLDDVSFKYPETEDDQAVLKNLSLHIEAGQWVGIVGPSGMGKTTLAGLIMKLFSPEKGQLLLDGKPYREFELSHLRSHMAYVSQEPLLFDLSLMENIRFGMAEATDEDVRKAARQGGVLEFSDRFQHGLDTLCGERGNRLSGGQKQRVALARAFLRNPGILILDEPTSSLDAKAEDGIRQSLKELMQGRTAIVIAHRLSLVRDLDSIFVISDGKVLQSGTHKELMRHDGTYKNLYNLQQGEFISTINKEEG